MCCALPHSPLWPWAMGLEPGWSSKHQGIPGGGQGRKRKPLAGQVCCRCCRGGLNRRPPRCFLVDLCAGEAGRAEAGGASPSRCRWSLLCSVQSWYCSSRAERDVSLPTAMPARAAPCPLHQRLPSPLLCQDNRSVSWLPWSPVL